MHTINFGFMKPEFIYNNLKPFKWLILQKNASCSDAPKT